MKLILLAALFLVACGTEVKTLGQQKREEIPGKACPKEGDEPFHDINIQFTGPPPGKLALVLDGEEEVNECKKSEVKPPLVTMERFASNQIGIYVEHSGAYPELPREFSLKLLNLGNCSVAPVEFYAVEKIPLEFKVEYPNGSKCAPLTYARVRLVKP